MKRILTINEFKQHLSLNESKKGDEEKLASLKRQLREWDEEHETELAKKRKGSSQQKKERLRNRILRLQKKIKRESEKVTENYTVNTNDLSPVLLDAYTKLKTQLQPFETQIIIVSAAENNQMCKDGIIPEENLVEDTLNCIIIADNWMHEEFDENKPTLDGAYSVEEQNGQIVAIWLPYPEKPIIGIDNIITAITNQLAE